MEPIPLPPTLPLYAWAQPIDTDGMAGTLRLRVSDQHADVFVANRVTVLLEQDLRPIAPNPYATWFHVDRRVLEDAMVLDSHAGMVVGHVAQSALDRWLRPWTQWYVTPCPQIDLFPRTTAAWRLALAIHRDVVRLWERLRFELLPTKR